MLCADHVAQIIWIYYVMIGLAMNTLKGVMYP